MRVSEVMHRGVTWCSPDTSLAEVARILRDQDIGAVPIGENDRLIGIVTDRDICCRGVAGQKLASLTARDVMSEAVTWCSEEETLDDVLDRMQHHHVRRLPVMNKDRRMVGMLSLGDIAHMATHSQCKTFTCAVSAHHR